MEKHKPLLLIISQTFVPDPAAVGQQMADIAFAMAKRGHRVRVYASARGYDDATQVYAARETLHGADIHRLPFASFGKRSLYWRILGTFSFQLQVLLRGLFVRDLSGIFFSTSPPLVGIVAAIIGVVRRVPIIYWAMDLNPDQLIALGKIRPEGLTARLLEAVNRFILNRSRLVIALDRFMADRLKGRAPLANKLIIIPPWAHQTQIAGVQDSRNPFIQKYNLDGKFVLMYSGNHSPSNPLDTILEAALFFRNDPALRFVFIGGGTGKKGVELFVETHSLTNVVCLPYQPLEGLKYSLGAADIHIVSLGEQMVGVLHPCKIYGAMAASKPVLYLGPYPSHITDILDAHHSMGWSIIHDDVGRAVRCIETIRKTNADVVVSMGQRAAEALAGEFSQALLCDRLCSELESTLKMVGG